MPPAPPAGESAAADLPPWLRDSDDSSAPAAPASSGAPSASWLAEIGVEDDPARAGETTPAPDWLAQLQQETPPAASAGQATEELPAWLRADLESAPASTPPTTAGGVPDWLREIEAEPVRQEAPPSAPQTEALPDWLREIETPPAVPSVPAGSASEDLPPWLRDDAPGLVPTSEPPRASAAPSAAPGAPADELPDWLKELEPPPGAAQPAGTSVPAGGMSDELPPWLRSDESVAPPAPAPRATEELPAWLAEVDVPAAPPAPPASPTPAIGATQELPAWLAEVDVPAAPPAPTAPAVGATQELPAWLAEVDLPSAPSAASPPTPTTGATEELPAWLGLDEPAAAPAGGEELPPWLRSDDQPAAASAPTAAAEDLPAWLRDDAAPQELNVPLPDWSSEFGAPPTGEATEASSAEELPAWLQDTTPPVVAAATASAAVAPPPAEPDLPAWLRDESAAAPVEPSVGASPTQPLPVDERATEVLPAWLLDEPLAATPTSSAAPPAADDALPPWLHSTEEPAPPADSAELPPWLALPDSAMAETAPPAAAADDLPPWLAAEEPSAAEHPTARTYDAPADDLPPWLVAEDQPEPHTARAYDVAAPPPSTNETVELPAWLAEAESPGVQDRPATSSQTADGDLPPWLAGIDADQPPTTPHSPAAALPSWLEEPEQGAARPAAPAAPQSEFLGGLDLPAWLRDEQPATNGAAAPVAEAAPAWLQVAPESDEPVAPRQAVIDAPAAPRVARTPERVAAMQLLEQLVTAPAPEPTPPPASRRPGWLLPLLVALAALVLIGALAYVLLNGRFVNLGATPAPAPAAAQAVALLAGLPPNRPVVLAYEWDARRLGDLQPLEEAVLSRLVRRTDVPLVFLSTDPQGALLATDRAERVLAIPDQFHSAYGLGTTNLGFKAGGTVALRRIGAAGGFGTLFAQDASGNDLRAAEVPMQTICGGPTVSSCGWDDPALLVVLADELDDVRGWFEQVRASQPALPMLLLTSAEVRPQAQPYATLPGVTALAGVSAADDYLRAQAEADRAAGLPVDAIAGERVGRQADATALGGAIFAALVLIGAGPAYLTGRRVRQEAEDEAWER